MPETPRPPEKTPTSCAHLPDLSKEYFKCLDTKFDNLKKAERANTPVGLTEDSWEAPADALAQLMTFGVHWNNKGFTVPGTKIQWALDNRTTGVLFKTNTDSVKIIVLNIDAPNQTLVIKADSLLQDGQELDFGGGITFAQIMNALKEKRERVNRPLPQIKAIYDTYGSSGVIKIMGKEDEGPFMIDKHMGEGPLKYDEIGVYDGRRSGNPYFFFEKGYFVQAHYHENKMTPAEFDAYVQKMAEKYGGE